MRGIASTSWPIISEWIAQNASRKPLDELVKCALAAASRAASRAPAASPVALARVALASASKCGESPVRRRWLAAVAQGSGEEEEVVGVGFGGLL
eukprot:7386080-Prymnesium_polylepis.1